MQWETEFALNFVAASRAGKIGAIGKVAAADAAEVKSLTQDQKFYADGEMIGQSIHPFSTKGLIVDRPQDFSVGRDMMNEYIKMGVGVGEAKLKTIALINSGSRKRGQIYFSSRKGEKGIDLFSGLVARLKFSTDGGQS